VPERRGFDAQDPNGQAPVLGVEDGGALPDQIETPHGLRTCFEARIPGDGNKDLVARLGGIPLQRNGAGFITDPSRSRCPPRARS